MQVRAEGPEDLARLLPRDPAARLYVTTVAPVTSDSSATSPGAAGRERPECRREAQQRRARGALRSAAREDWKRRCTRATVDLNTDGEHHWLKGGGSRGGQPLSRHCPEHAWEQGKAVQRSELPDVCCEDTKETGPSCRPPTRAPGQHPPAGQARNGGNTRG
ncbi:unnamed protein product [Rangifer tarandus platyrhynchus]|uniref:Uncharacterized protein n=2 Tax=Rangifer tarandus platyrhynchus TaxID=3082113 RepID=A0ABN8YYN1_RANTA|nr:unnamed protein product [Rangifer tarandus platyrhynchus]CAI9702389.1 unnamed protein product [Rangifer tarandus platyrhynchus]